MSAGVVATRRFTYPGVKLFTAHMSSAISICRKCVQPLGAKKSDEVFVAKQLFERGSREEQTCLADLGLLSHHLLPKCFLLKRAQHGFG